jgi:putative transposase
MKPASTTQPASHLRPHHPAHPPPVRRHNEPIVLHVTLTTCERRPILDNEAAHKALVTAWREANHWRAGEYVVMPDHVHVFCVPGAVDYPAIRRWVGYWKRLVGRADGALKSVFQEDCWDTQMRTREQYDEKLSYIRNNPVRKGLASSWELWPYRGRVFDVSWF